MSDNDSEDTFDSSDSLLGPNWMTNYGGSGEIAAINHDQAQWNPTVQARLDQAAGFGYVFRTNEEQPADRSQWVGCRVTRDTVCSQCGKPVAVTGHCIVLEARPNMAGTVRHTDCDDPTLSRRS